MLGLGAANAQRATPAVYTTTPYTGYSNANSIAVDAAGDIFVANGNTNSFIEQPAGGGAQITLVSGLAYPIATAVDTNGYAYVGSYSGSLYKVPVGGGTAVDLIMGNSDCNALTQYYVGPLGIAVDGSQNVYFVGVSGTGPPPNTSGQAVYEINAAGVCSVLISSTTLGGAVPSHVASDPAGNVSYSIGTTLYTLPVGATTPVQVSTASSSISAFNAIMGLRADKYGNVFVTDSSTIDKVPFISGALNGSKTVSVLSSSSTVDVGIATNGTLYTTDGINILLNQIDSIWAVGSDSTRAQLNEAGAAVTTAVGTSGAASTFGGVAFDSTGNVWSVSSGANALNFNSYAGTGSTAYTGGGLSTPASVAVDGQGFIWVANSGNNSVSVFNNGGTAQSGTTGFATASVTAPSALRIDATGGVWVTNKTANTLTHILGAATPVVTPLAGAVAAGTLGVTP